MNTNAKLQSCLRNPLAILLSLSLLASNLSLPAESDEFVLRIRDQALIVPGSVGMGIENTRTISDGCLVEKWVGSTMRRSSLQALMTQE